MNLNRRFKRARSSRFWNRCLPVLEGLECKELLSGPPPISQLSAHSVVAGSGQDVIEGTLSPWNGAVRPIDNYDEPLSTISTSDPSALAVAGPITVPAFGYFNLNAPAGYTGPAENVTVSYTSFVEDYQTRDTSFTASRQAFATDALAVQTDGKIIAVGPVTTGNPNEPFNFGVTRYNTSGTVDSTYAGGNSLSVGVSGASCKPTCVTLQLDGKILVGGTYQANGDAHVVDVLMRFNANGTIDSTFGSNGIILVAPTTNANNALAGIAVQSDGKIIGGGEFDLGSTKSGAFGAFRLNSDGSVDSTFGGGFVSVDFGTGNDVPSSMIIQPDGKIVLAGTVNNGTTNQTFGLARFTTSGVLDKTFGINGIVSKDVTGYNEKANALAIQSDGKLLVAGQVSGNPNNNANDMVLARFNCDGSLDPNFFNTGVVITNHGGDDRAESVVIDGDGIITLGGVGYSTGVPILQRFNQLGWSENAVTPTGQQVDALAVQPSGRLIIADPTGHVDGWYGTETVTGSDVVSVQPDVAPTVTDDSYSVAEDTTLNGVYGTSFQFTSQSNESVGHGKSYLFTPADSSITAWGRFGRFSLEAFRVAMQDDYSIDIATPLATLDTAGPNFAQGLYTNAMDYPATVPNVAAISIAGGGGGTSTNQFAVDDVQYDALGNILAFQADYVLNTRSLGPSIIGRVSYNAIDNSQPGLLDNDSGYAGHHLTATLLTGPSHGTLTLLPSGRFAYTPNPEYVGTDSFTYQANDGTLTSAPATVHLTITPDNDQSIAVGDTYGISSRQFPLFNLTVPASVGVLANDRSELSGPLTATLVSSTSHGNLQLNSDGSFTYIPTTYYRGVDSFTYRASDGTSTSNVATVTIDVSPDLPTDSSIILTTSMNKPVTYDISTLDNDSSYYRYLKPVSLPSHGTLTVSPSGVTYTPNLNFSGVDSFTFAGGNSVGIGNPSIVTINVTKTPYTLSWPNPANIMVGTALSSTQLDATSSIPGTFTYAPDAGVVLLSGVGQMLQATFTPTDSATYAPSSIFTYINVGSVTPVISWAKPADITYGTALSAAQENASANVPGSFVYSQPIGTTLLAGPNQILTLTFTPTDTNAYATVTATVLINVLKATPVLTWPTPADIVFGTPLSGIQLDATSNVGGAIAYTPPSGTTLASGQGWTLSATFTPSDGRDYNSATITTKINVNPAAETINWPSPPDIVYGTALGATQLNATANVPGMFQYSPALGTILTVGNSRLLSVTFTPTDTVDYSVVTASTTINVLQATPTINWPAPANITYGTYLDSTQLDATASVPGLFYYSPGSGRLPAGNGQLLSLTFVPTDQVNYAVVTASTTINVLKATPTVTWPKPADITYGTVLGATQLDATANAPGNFAYSPVTGTVMNAGQNQTLSLTFTPTDSVDYNPVTTTTSINVLKATPSITWSNPADITYGTALGATQLDATASVPGTFTYTPVVGMILRVGQNQTLSVTFTPTDAVDYQTATANTMINVLKAAPTVTWSTPADISYGTPLDSSELNATASIPGIFVYTPASGALLKAGQGQTLSVTFNPTDAVDYQSVTASTTINVVKAAPSISWSNPADIVYGAALDSSELNATASIPGVFTYLPVGGTVLHAGQWQSLTAVFTPTDTADYSPINTVVRINVLKATPIVAWPNPADITYGTPLGAAQLNANANVPGTYSYRQSSGTILAAGQGQSLSLSFTPDDTNDYNSVNTSETINVLKATPAINWPNPADIPYGTILGASQLNATSNVAGSFTYAPAAGARLSVGAGQSLLTIFTPADAANYKAVSATAKINVLSVASQLAFTASVSAGQIAGQSFTVTVTVEDSTGTAVPSFSGLVTIALGINPINAALGGTHTVATINGVATFSGLTINKPGTGYTLIATSGMLPAKSSATFNFAGASISGEVFNDTQATGSLVTNGNDPGLANRIVYIDSNNNGVPDASEISTATNTNGQFRLSGLTLGADVVRVVTYPGDLTFGPSGNAIVANLTPSNVNATVNIGLQPTSLLAPFSPNANPFGTHVPNVETAEVNGIYQLVFNRAPEPAGQAAAVKLLQSGWTPQQLANLFVSSAPEYYQKIVSSFYVNFLGRMGAAQDVSAGAALLKGGYSSVDLAQFYLTCPEFNIYHADNTEFVNTIYHDVLGREATSTEVANMVNQLKTGSSRTTVVSTLIHGNESITRAASGFYTEILARPGDTAGIASNVALVMSGQTSLISRSLGFFDFTEFMLDAKRHVG